MDKPERFGSGEAMRWNDDVERRRREYHEQRCARTSWLPTGGLTYDS